MNLSELPLVIVPVSECLLTTGLSELVLFSDMLMMLPMEFVPVV